MEIREIFEKHSLDENLIKTMNSILEIEKQHINKEDLRGTNIVNQIENIIKDRIDE